VGPLRRNGHEFQRAHGEDLHAEAEGESIRVGHGRPNGRQATWADIHADRPDITEGQPGPSQRAVHQHAQLRKLRIVATGRGLG